MTYEERRRDALKALRPKTDPIRFIRPGRCSGSWLDKNAKGCGHVVRLHYMLPPTRTKLGRLSKRWQRAFAWIRFAMCPICGEQYLFAFYKLKGDDEYVARAEEEQDIRAFWADARRIAVTGADPAYGRTRDELIAIHSLAPPKEESPS